MECNPKFKPIKINEEAVHRAKILYQTGHSCPEISKKLKAENLLSVCPEMIRRILRRNGVAMRDAKSASITYYRTKEPVEEVLTLYEKNIPLRELERRFKISRGTIRKILQEKGVTIKKSRDALVAMGRIKEKEKFFLDKKEKAYLFGLVMGDLTPVKRSEHNLRVVTNTTHPIFIDHLCKTFEKYGYVQWWENKNKDNDFQFHASLDFSSFSFLMDKKKEEIPSWINEENFLNFLAGFIDADGSVIINRHGRGIKCALRFFGQEVPVLKKIQEDLMALGYNATMSKTHPKGRISYHKGVEFKYNRDYYTLELQRKREVMDLLERLTLRHPEKIMKKKVLLKILRNKIRGWSEVQDEVTAIRLKIRESVKQQINQKLNRGSSFP